MNNEDDQYKASNFIKKNKGDEQYHSSNFMRKKESPKADLLERAANSVEHYINEPIEALGRSGGQILGGAAQGLANIAPGLYNLGANGFNALGGNIPKSPMIDVVPHTPSATAGDIGSFFLGPGLIKGLGKIPELSRAINHAMKLPILAKGMKHASNILGKSPITSRIAGNALLGGAYAPEDPLMGLGLGAVGGATGEAVAKGYSGIKNQLMNNETIKKTIAKFNPAAHQKDIEHQLSQGANNITENSRQLATDIRNAHNMRNEEAQVFYNHALKSAGKEPIYGVAHKDIFPSNVPELARQESTFDKIKSLNMGDLFNKFKSNPTFANAHTLQSELGFMKRDLQSNPLKTQDDKFQIKKIADAQHQVKDDINHFLEKRDLNTNHPIGQHYKKASELFEENVAPFYSDKKLIDIVKNGKTVVKNLNTIFNTPSNKITKEGIEKIGSINKIMKDLPPSSKNRIIFDAIGGNKLSPEALMKKLSDIKSKGFESYFSPEVEESIKSLEKKLKNRNALNKTASIAGGVGGAGAALKVFNHLF